MTTNKNASGLSARPILTDSSGVDFIAVPDGADGNVVLAELSPADGSTHHLARAALAETN